MAITYQSGRRLQATSTDFAGIPAVSGGWKEVGRTTLGSANTTIDVTSLADKRYYMVLSDVDFTTLTATRLRLNSDNAGNYASRWSADGSTDSTNTSSATTVIHGGTPAASEPFFNVMYMSNLATKEKLIINHNVNRSTAGAGTAPTRLESVIKHAQTTNPISSVQYVAGATHSIGSEVVVLGWDPADTHTTNFWEELASVDLSGGAADTLDASFTAKKYIWYQWFVKATGGTVIDAIRVGNTTIDTGANYAQRRSTNGATDGVFTGLTNWGAGTGVIATGEVAMGSGFIINNASNEKLSINHSMLSEAAGAGTEPSRKEHVGKWANTSNQIDIIQLLNNAGTGDMGTETILKVWGSD